MEEIQLRMMQQAGEEVRKKRKKRWNRMKAVCDFYEIAERGDGLVDVWMTPGEVVPIRDDLTGRTDYGIRVRVAHGVDPKDPQWGGNLEAHVREHYAAWLEMAEEVEV